MYAVWVNFFEFELNFICPYGKVNIYNLQSIQYDGLGAFMKPFQAFCSKAPKVL